MLKNLFATTALATMVAWGAQAQTNSQAEPTAEPRVNHMAPTAEEDAEPNAPVVPETANSEMAPAETGTEMAQPEAPATDGEMAPAADTEMAQPEAPAATEMAEPATPPLEEGWTQVDVATISADMLIGTDIRTYDQETVASVEDVLMTADGKVENVVARFGGFLGFGENTVLLTMQEISVVKDADGAVVVLTNLTPDALKDRPEYVPEDEQG